MSATHTPYECTHQGIVEAWTRRYVPGFQRDRDYEAWREQVGAKKANAVMREVTKENGNVREY